MIEPPRSAPSLPPEGERFGPADAASKPRRIDFAFLRRHPAHWIALGFGSGLAPWAPGTVGTLWAWAAFLIIDRWIDAAAWGIVIAVAAVVGIWACTLTARHAGIADPGAIVWDEVVGFWLVLWLVMPASLLAQVLAFALFRVFDAVKRGPVGWADGLFKGKRGAPIGWRQGFGIVFDDVVAALCTLLVIALWTALWR